MFWVLWPLFRLVVRRSVKLLRIFSVVSRSILEIREGHGDEEEEEEGKPSEQARETPSLKWSDPNPASKHQQNGLRILRFWTPLSVYKMHNDAYVLPSALC